MKKSYWECVRKDGSLVEGQFSLARRIFGSMFNGETFIRVDTWDTQ